jgi:hypothetical protein
MSRKEIAGSSAAMAELLIIEGVDPDDRRAVRQMLDRMLAHPPREDELDHIVDIARRAAARLAARPERLPRS